MEREDLIALLRKFLEQKIRDSKRTAEYIAKRREEDPEFREKHTKSITDGFRRRYHSDPEFREKHLAARRKKYEESKASAQP
jgi:hypothetical protein